MESDFFKFFTLDPEGDHPVAAVVWCLVQYNQWNSSNSQRHDWRWWNHCNAWGYEMKVFFFSSQALSVSCPFLSKCLFFVQLQRGERWGERRESFWKLRERGTSLLCLTWSENPQKHTDVDSFALHPEQILPHLCCCFFAISSKKIELQIFTAETL